MIDTLLANLDRFDVAKARSDHGLTDRYAVATLHRPSNVDDPADAAALVKAMHAVADQVEVLLPLHPRGRRASGARPGCSTIPGCGSSTRSGTWSSSASSAAPTSVITDSGGVQEETTILGIPCLTLRPNTERPVTITHGTNQLVTRDASPRPSRTA